MHTVSSYLGLVWFEPVWYFSLKDVSHSFAVTYTRDWDMDIISQLEATKNEMAVLSTYLSDVTGNIDKNGKSLINTRPIMCNTDYENGQNNKYLRHGSQPEAVPTIRGTPELQPYWAAGYSFSRGHFVVTTPYDFYQPMIFQGEVSLSHGTIRSLMLRSNTHNKYFSTSPGNVHRYPWFHYWL